MNIISWPKKKIRRRMNSKGFSSIVGAIFMMLIVWALASAYFVYTMSQNTIYNVAVRERNQLDIDRMSESVQVSNTTYSVNVNNNVNVTAQIQNTGPSSIQFLTIWIYASNSTGWSNYNFTPVNITVQGGSAYPLNINLTLTGIYTTSSYDITSWLITTRGNTVPLPKQPAITNNIIWAETTQGIGSLAMDFQNFTYYNVTGSKPPYSFWGYPTGASGYYVQGATLANGQVAFRVIIRNLDRNQRTITLSGKSVLFAIFPTQGTQPRGAYWYIVNVNVTTGEILGTYTSVTLAFNVPTTLYFASQWPSSDSRFPAPWGSSYTGIAAVNLALVGTIGGDPFGQNIPFVSIEVVS